MGAAVSSGSSAPRHFIQGGRGGRAAWDDDNPPTDQTRRPWAMHRGRRDDDGDGTG